MKNIKPTYEELEHKIIELESKLVQPKITELKQVEQELKKAKEIAEDCKEKYRLMYEFNPMPMFIFDYKTLAFLSANSTFLNKYGFSREELSKMTIFDIRPKSEIKLIKQLLKIEELQLPLDSNKNRNINIGVFTHKTKNEEIIQVEVIGHQLDYNKRKAKLIIINDVTDKINAQNDLLLANIALKKAKEKAEGSNRLKSAFLANMGHEIRTPMNGILGFADLLKERELSIEKKQKYIEIIENSGTRMLNIINDIVDISKIEAGMMKLDIKESNINEQIEYIYTFFKPEVKDKGMKILYKNPLPAKEAIIKTDQEKVYAILTNLVKNAIKYSEKGSIEFGYLKKRKIIEFYVKDTGIGIPKDRQLAIFERFIQADISNKMARQGAGLGLSISKAYVEMLGGNIWVESEESIGSTFYFTLPYNAMPKEKKRVEKVIQWQTKMKEVKNLKILIAEDDETSEILITTNVEKFSNEILTARNGFEAVEVCRNNPDIDLILMDIRMPMMSGHEATRKIREFNKDVIIIAQTAFALSGDREKTIEAGCNDYITKPIDKDQLLTLIQGYFN